MTTNENEFTSHESFGLLSFGHVQRSKPTNLFGSSINHKNTIKMTINTAVKRRSLHKDWHHPEQELIEVEMSYTQFAEAITSMNRGVGVPVTLRNFNGNTMEECPEENKRIVFENEFEQEMIELSEKVTALSEDSLRILSDKKAPSKSDRELIHSQIESLSKFVRSNIPFISSKFSEQMDRTVLEAKVEAEAHTQNIIHSLGLKEFENELSQLRLENTGSEE